jgi:hypothetical protein
VAVPGPDLEIVSEFTSPNAAIPFNGKVQPVASAPPKA